MNEQAVSPWVQFIPFLLLSTVVTVFGVILAREKGRNVALWAVLGFVPIVNILCLLYFVGATDLRLDRKIDRLIARLDPVANRADSAQKGY